MVGLSSRVGHAAQIELRDGVVRLPIDDNVSVPRESKDFSIEAEEPVHLVLDGERLFPAQG